MIAWLILGVLVAALVVLAWRSGSGVGSGVGAEESVERPGTDEQWTDLADAMRRYRRHKQRDRVRGGHRAL